MNHLEIVVRRHMNLCDVVLRVEEDVDGTRNFTKTGPLTELIHDLQELLKRHHQPTAEFFVRVGDGGVKLRRLTPKRRKRPPL
jgi:hypothetical protein